MTSLRRDRAVRVAAAHVAAALAIALVITACAAEPAATDAAGTATPPATVPAPTPPPAPAPPAPPAAPSVPDTSERPRIAITNPDLDWPFDADLDRIEAFPALLDAAFDMGAKEGMGFLAEHSWPDGYTADSMLACRRSEPTPTYAELDADAHRYRVEFRPVSPAPGFVYPPTGEYPADLGLRVYLGRLVVVTEERGTEVDTLDDIGRLAARPRPEPQGEARTSLRTEPTFLR